MKQAKEEIDMKRIKRAAAVILIAVMALTAVLSVGLAAEPVSAATAVKTASKTAKSTKLKFLYGNDVVIGGRVIDRYLTTVYGKNGGANIVSAVPADPEILKAEFEGEDLDLIPLKKGKTTVTVTDEDGLKGVLNVTVKAEFFTSQLEGSVYLDGCWYGRKKIVVSSVKGTKVTLKVGDDKYDTLTFTEDGDQEVKLKKVYPLNTKIRATVKKGKYKVVIKRAVFSDSEADVVKVKGKTVKLTCSCMHKGDVIKFTYKGKTWKLKMKKDYDGDADYRWYTIKTNKKIPKNAKIKVKIVNKYNEKLFEGSMKLKNGQRSFWASDRKPQFE